MNFTPNFFLDPPRSRQHLGRLVAARPRLLSRTPPPPLPVCFSSLQDSFVRPQALVLSNQHFILQAEGGPGPPLPPPPPF